jgi:glyoxylase-like metal-dependent hydrolase (beta-lactamase superfamily II)
MKSTALTDSTTQLTRFGIVNVYLVREPDGLTLVDTAVFGTADGIIAAAAELGAPIVRIALTHGHGDHVGSLDALAGKLGPEVEVVAPARDAELMAGNKQLTAEEAAHGKLKGGWPMVKTKPGRLLAPGDSVGSLEVVATPGHTPGHIAFLDTRDRSVICGDALHTLGGTTVTGKLNWRFPLPTLATWSAELALESARELAALEPSLLAPGHGKGLPAPGAEIAAAIAAAS